MAIFTNHHAWGFAFGVLGNVLSFMVYLAPIPTFRRVLKKKSTEGFQSIPYLVALFAAELWLYYALIRTNVILLITINSTGCVIEIIYITIYLIYAPKEARTFTVRLLLLFNLGGFCLILLISNVLVKGSHRLQVLGWIGMVFTFSVFVAPLSVIKVVIQTKSVEFLPLSLSVFLTLSAVMWFFYGILQKDFFLALPNVLGFIFGMIQMFLHVIYRKKKTVIEDPKLPEHAVDFAKLNTNSTTEVHPAGSLQPTCDDHEGENRQNAGNESVQAADNNMGGSNQV